jgi:SAM-dependent methyltransferase
MHCAICGQEIDIKPLYDHKGYKLYHCRSCDVMFWHPMKNPGVEWYDASFFYCGRRLAWLKPKTVDWNHARFLKDTPVRGGKLLDVGCGTGDFLIMAQGAGYSVTGIDFSQTTIEIARSRFGLKELYPYSLEQLLTEKPGVKYDVIVFFELLEHLDDVPGFMNSVKKLLKPGGFVALSVPNRDRWRVNPIGFSVKEWDCPPNHLTRWNIPALENLFTSQGFSVLSTDVEPLGASDWAWNFFVTERLGIHPLVQRFAARALGKGDNSTVVPGKTNFLSTIAKLAANLYLNVFVPALGMITLPLRALLRTQGTGIYVLARLKN